MCYVTGVRCKSVNKPEVHARQKDLHCKKFCAKKLTHVFAYCKLNMSITEGTVEVVKRICPSKEELSVIINSIRCAECNLVFRNEPRFRMHDLKVHKHQKLDKSVKEIVWYHCPVKTCVYAPESQKHFTLYKYLKQVRYKMKIEHLY